MAPNSAGLAVTFGFTNVRAYLEGEPAWTARGYNLYASNEFVTTGNIVLIDLRSTDKAVAGRIPRSLSIPYDELYDRIADIPRRAPVVLYSDNREEAMDALFELREARLRLVSLVDGNFQGWVDAGGEVERGGVVSTEITWQRILGKGEITVAEFRAAMEGKMPNVVLLDVRTVGEVAYTGLLPNAIHIPLHEISVRIDTLPRDKKIFVYCLAGSRAELAYKELKAAGFDAKFIIYDFGDLQ